MVRFAIYATASMLFSYFRYGAVRFFEVRYDIVLLPYGTAPFLKYGTVQYGT